MTMDSKTREEFEAWVLKYGHSNKLLLEMEDEVNVQYADDYVEMAWIGWQASQPSPAPELLKQCKEALEYIEERFRNEVWICPECGHEESTNNCDSHSFVKSTLEALRKAGL